jgi:myxalamid-type polyketide synthase MxaB
MNATKPGDEQALMKKALHEIRELRAKVESLERANCEPVAIIGMACRFPGADNPAAFWELLARGGDAIREVPKERWDVAEFYDPDPDAPGKMYSKWGGFLEDIDKFSAEFFGIAPREAMFMDPQQRLLLEVGWEALENAAVVPGRLLHTQVGVFVGLGTTDYGDLQVREGIGANDAYNGTGGSHSVAAGRLSYLLGVRGPSYAVDTACSSSLATIHLAVNSLRHRESDLALAGGVNVSLCPDVNVSLCKARMLSPDGRCKTFDRSANGYVRGEGCGVLVLKRLSDALAHRDNILAVIRGSAVNHDGRSSGLTVPSGPSQQELIRRALRNAGLRPAEVAYVEAHGTGTPVGDPIEIGALGNVFGERTNPLLVGSVKTNTGHLEWAAGVCGVIKVVLSMRHGQIPASLHFKDPNPYIPWDDLPIRVVTERTPWPGGRRIAGVSSFGFGGTNAHVLVEEAPAVANTTAGVERPLHFFTLSAKTDEALRAQAGCYARLLVDPSSGSLEDICYTANSGRSHFEQRLTTVVASKNQLQERLQAVTAGDNAAFVQTGRVREGRPKIALLFTGQGSQSVGMGRELYETQPAFRRTLEGCAEILRGHLDCPLLEVLFPADQADGQLLHQTAYTQPALFALEYALAELWLSWGVRPSYVLGHSVGEYVAACVAGVFSLEDGLNLIAARARLMQALPANGAMVAVRAAEARVAEFVAPHSDFVAIATVNGPQDVVISGERQGVAAIVTRLSAAGVATQPLKVSHAFHSPLTEPMLAEFERIARGVRFSTPRLGLISNLTGKEIREEVTQPTYWVRHVREAVRFAAGMATLAEQGCDVFVEAGPHPTLLGLGRTCLPGADALWLPSLRSQRGDWQQMLESLGALYLRGADIDWAALDRGYTRRKVELPTYPFERKRYWFPVSAQKAGPGRRALRPLIDTLVQSPLVKETILATPFSTATQPYLKDHRVFGDVVVPGACYLEMILSGQDLLGHSTCRVEDAFFQAPLVLPENEERILQAVLTPEEAGTAEGSGFQIISLGPKGSSDEVTTHVTGRVSGTAPDALSVLPLARIESRAYRTLDPAEFTAWAGSRGIDYGPTFRWMDSVWLGKGESLARLRLPEAVAGSAAGFWIHPGLLDACFQVAGTSLSDDDAAEAMVPFALKSLKAARVGEGPVWWCHATLVGEFRWDIRLTEATGQVVVEIEGFELRKAPRQTFLRRRLADWLYRLEWQPQSLTAESRTNGAPGTWLILGDAWGRGERLATRLTQQGDRCVLATLGTAFQQDGQSTVERVALNPNDPAEFHSLLDVVQSDGQPPCKGVVYLWGTESPRDAADMPDWAETLSIGVLHLVQALGDSGLRPRLWLVTEGGQAVQHGDPVQPAQASVWGLGRTLLLEYPELECVCVDLSPEPGADNLSSLLAELRGPAAEPQVAYRSGGRSVARLVRHRETRKPAPQGAFRIRLADYGSPDQLRLEPLTRRRPGADEVEIEVKAVALNFRDVLIALGMLKEYYAKALGIARAEDVNLGFDGAGTISAVGESVTKFKVGDEVVAAFAGIFSSHAIESYEFVAHKPVGMSFEAAATLPVAFLTAYIGLHQIAHLKRGERVLIHVGAGGVGQAAIQWARHVGAEIYTTASPGKWEFLQAQGVDHVLNSRTLAFADEVLRLTGGEGVDVVLNSLSGEACAKSLAVLKRGGRFVEIGKLGALEQDEVAQLRPDVAYFTFDLNTIIVKQPSVIPNTLDELRPLFETGQLSALPQMVFPVQDVVEAYRYVQQTRHVGKVVLRLDTESGPPIRPDASYLITGGLGALGLHVARELVNQGARHLVFAGRGPGTTESSTAVAELRAAGASVQAVRADVANADDVARLVAACQAEAPLRGVVHAAGVLDDGVLEKQSAERFAKVLAPKVRGAWHLHTHTRELPLDFFVCFSSMASLLGAPGQSNYAAANAFLDALAHHRRTRGLPGLSINWGPWADAGMAAKLSLAGQGLEKIDPESGRQVFAELLASAQGTSPAQAGVFRIHWPVFRQRLPSDAAAALLSSLVRQTSKPQPGVPDEFLRRFHAAAEGERQDVLEGYVHGQLLKALGLETSKEIVPTQPWQQLGLDSLMMVELKNRLERTLRVTLPVKLLTQDVNTRVLATFLAGKLTNGAPAAARDGDAAEALSEEDLRKSYERVAQIPQAFVVAQKQQGRRILADGHWRLDFASCNYLGLDFEPEVMTAIPPALQEWGVHPSWSRAVASPQIYEELEQELAALVGAPTTLVFPSISLLHIGVLPILAGYNGVIFKDTDAHHSIHEGCLRAQANGAEWSQFRHNDLKDLTEKLERVPRERTKIIATDGVYSMGSPNPPLLDYVGLAKKYNALIYVDDAHGFGVIGENPDARLPYGYRGNGMVRHLGLDHGADRIVYVAGLSKAFSSYAAFVTCFDEELKWKLRATGPFIFSGPTCVASLASALAGLRVNARDGDRKRRHIFDLTHRFVTAVRAMGFEVDNGGFFPIVGVVIGGFDDLVKACQLLWEHDVLITPAMYPAVPLHRGLVRFSITAANTEEEVDHALRALQAVRDSLNAVSNGAKQELQMSHV